MQLTRAEAQAANVIVTTPEKWDVVTRKSGTDENSLGNQCGLLIIDEVHLLADDRGAVIESIVARLHRLVESRQKQLRIVGLSAMVGCSSLVRDSRILNN
jgi:replicative superfamily II helicase